MGRAGAGLVFTGIAPEGASGLGPGEGAVPRCADGDGAPVGAGLATPGAALGLGEAGAAVAATARGAAVGAVVGALVGAGVARTGFAVAGCCGAAVGFGLGAGVTGAALGCGVTGVCFSAMSGAVGTGCGTSGIGAADGMAIATCVGCGLGGAGARGTGVGLGGAFGFCLASTRCRGTGGWPARTRRALGGPMCGAFGCGMRAVGGAVFTRRFTWT